MIFVDTWAWIGLAVKRDQYHARIQAQHKEFCETRTVYVTSDHVLAEVITFLFRVSLAGTAEAFVGSLLAAIDAGTCRLVRVSHEQFLRAWQLRVKYRSSESASFLGDCAELKLIRFSNTQADSLTPCRPSAGTFVGHHVHVVVSGLPVRRSARFSEAS